MLRHSTDPAQVFPSITSYYKHCAKHFPALLCTTSLAQSIYFPVQIRTTSIAQSSFQYYFVLQNHLPVLLCTTRLAQSTPQYYFVLPKNLPVLLCTTKFAQSTSQYYFVLQSLHKLLPCLKCYVILQTAQVFPSITSYYKHCAKHFPALLCTTSLAQSIYFPVQIRTTSIAQSSFQYYFVLQDSHKVRPSTTWYWKIIQNRLPVLLCSTSLAQRTSQYYFVLQSLHRVLPYLKYAWICLKQTWKLPRTTKPCASTSQYYFVLQALRKKYFPAPLDTTSLAQSTYFPVLLRTTSIAQSSTWYYKNTSQYFFALQSECHEVPMTFLNFETSRLVAIFMGTARRDLETHATLDAWVPQSPTPAARNKVSQLHNISFYEVGRLLREIRISHWFLRGYIHPRDRMSCLSWAMRESTTRRLTWNWAWWRRSFKNDLDRKHGFVESMILFSPLVSIHEFLHIWTV